MAVLPSVWGWHPEAKIDPLSVRGQLITSIMDAPSDWNGRLVALGFRRTPTGWLKLGALKPAEYSYLSNEIDLVGFRVDEIAEAIEVPANPVPIGVRDALLSLWQRNTGAVLTALNMEHGVNLTRAQSWSFVETALSGAITPESETLIGLTLTKMRRDGALTGEVKAFADSLGWRSDTDALLSIPTEPLLFAAGETVRWADEHGVIQSGRLARRFSVSDTGCWVYQAPMWINGYSVAAPQYVRRDRIQFEGTAQDWQLEDLIEQVKPQPLMPLEASGADAAVVSLSPLTQRTLFRFLQYQAITVGELRSYLERVAADRDDALNDSPESLQELMAVADCLDELSARFYGDLPIRFGLMRGFRYEEGSGVALALVGPDGKLHSSRIYGFLIPKPEFLDVYDEQGALKSSTLSRIDADFATAAEQCEARRAEAEAEIRLTVKKSAGLTGLPGTLLTESAIDMGYFNALCGLSKQYSGASFTDAALSVLPVMLGGTSLGLDRFLSRNIDVCMSDNLRVQSSDLSLALNKTRTRFFALEGVERFIGEGGRFDGLSAAACDDVHSYDVTAYSSSLKLDEATFAALPDDLSICKIDDKDRRVYFSSYDEALGVYAKTLDTLDVMSAHDESVQIAKALLEKRDLVLRLNEVPAKIKAANRDDLLASIRAQLLMQSKNKLLEVGNENFRRMVCSVADSILENEKAQGAVLFVSKSAYRWRWWARPTELEAKAVFAEGRESVFGAQIVQLKESLRKRGIGYFVDALAVADPELSALLIKKDDNSAAEKQPAPSAEGYQDTGVVSGFAIKDMRSAGQADLLEMVSRMSDLQKKKYVTKDALWPRLSFEEMKEKGVDIGVAINYDLIWRNLPSKPKATTGEYVRAFVSLICAYRDHVKPLLGKSYDEFIDESSGAAQATSDAWNHFRDDPHREVYSYRDLGVRGEYSNLTRYRPSYSQQRALESITWASLIKEKKRASSATKSRVAAGDVVRIGPDYRNEKSVCGEDFIRTFGFSGVEYGNWTNQKEREKHLNLAFDSMMDFARVLGLDPLTLSLGGKLGLCIGSRGRGGARAASAHFEPANMAINLTRMRGDGSLAHEYFHAVAAHYGYQAMGSVSDASSFIGYPMLSPGNLPAVGKSGLSEPMQKAFFDLMASIIRAPDAGADIKDILSYQNRSGLLLRSIEADKDEIGKYFSSPEEMFARSMEVWFKQRLAEIEQRNDYLVGANKDAGSHPVYPTDEELGRINHFVSPWLDAITVEVSAINHPFLGEIEMPILKTELKSVMPLSSESLVKLAGDELNRLFGSVKPELVVIDDALHRAGLYDLSRDLIMLNQCHADAGTFYHEAWHTCHAKLLTNDERAGMDALFATDSALADHVEQIMHQRGVHASVIEHMRSDTQEVQAYAFQFWKEGAFSFDNTQGVGSFHKVGDFVDGVVGIGQMFGVEQAERLFKQFASGELADRLHDLDLQQSSELEAGQAIYIEAPEIEPEPPRKVSGFRFG